jgi:hypothetical protein
MNRREFFALSAAVPVAFGTRRAPPVAFVTCDTEARVALVDLGAGRVIRSLAVIPGPRAIERVASGLALVCHTVTGAVSIIDRRGVRHVLHELSEPRYAARHPDGVHAFVSDSGRELVAAIDVLRGRVLGDARLDGWARHLTLSPDARTLWVGLGNLADRISVVDVSIPARPRFLRQVRPPFLAHDVGFFPDGRHVWVTAGQAGATAIYRPDGRLVRTLSADEGPQHVTFGSRAAYVTSGAAGTFRVHALDGSLVRETRISAGTYNVQSGPGGLVLTPSLESGTLSVLDGNGRLLRTVAVSTSSHDACFAF